jgi:hypothetical protein
MTSKNWCSPELKLQLTEFCQSLVDQQHARIIVEPLRRASGYWFGGGNMVRAQDGRLHVVGRYRNAGDSRTGVAEGTRGLELTIFTSTDDGQTFKKTSSWDKPSLNSPLGDVLSIEGSCLRLVPNGVELYVSTEKTGIPYPDTVTDYLKPGTGVWSIDVLRADSIEELRSASVEPFLSSSDPSHLHVKDPFVWKTQHGDEIGFCSHPFNWSSSNTGIVEIDNSGSIASQLGVVDRGTTWDVAMTRGTAVLRVPTDQVADATSVSLLFYCGGESVRQLDEHATAVTRPRGYSCEELGGVIAYPDDDVARSIRLSELFPLFTSPHGTGCSRYVDVLETPDGYITTWQQSQSDLSQPLVSHFLPHETATTTLNR